jgi:hypothetical protein
MILWQHIQSFLIRSVAYHTTASHADELRLNRIDQGLNHNNSATLNQESWHDEA